MGKRHIIILLVLVLFALDAVAQVSKPEIVWKNLQDKYENFYDVRPSIQLKSSFPILINGLSDSVKLFRLDEKHNVWLESGVRVCGTGYKSKVLKLKPGSEIQLGLNKGWWEQLKIDDFLMSDFTKFADYDGQGKYKLGIRYGLNKTSLKDYSSLVLEFSPEFEVAEKDFKK